MLHQAVKVAAGYITVRANLLFFRFGFATKCFDSLLFNAEILRDSLTFSFNIHRLLSRFISHFLP